MRCSRTNSTWQISVNQSNFWNMIFYHFVSKIKIPRFEQIIGRYFWYFYEMMIFDQNRHIKIDVKWLKIKSLMNQGAFFTKKVVFYCGLKIVDRLIPPIELEMWFQILIYREFHHFRSKIVSFKKMPLHLLFLAQNCPNFELRTLF